MGDPESKHAEVAVFAGTFDPITLGHLDIIQRASAVFQRLVIGVGSNPEKRSLFSPEERVQLVEIAVAGFAGVSVRGFSGLTVSFVRKCNAQVILRGVRSVTDMEYEFTMARTNRILAPEVETVFLTASETFSHLSSTLIRQIASEADEKLLAQFVPTNVIGPLLEKYR